MSVPFSVEVASYHEAGHCVAACRLGVRVRFASVLFDGETLGKIRCVYDHRTPHETIAKIGLAGPAAEVRRWPDRLGKNPEAMDDVNAAAEESGVDADELLARLKREVEKLVDEHWPSIERVATVLQRHKVLTGAEVRDLI